MPENNQPAAKPNPEELPGEFDFAKPVEEHPRVKRRSLKPASGVPAAARELASEAPPRSAATAKPEYQPDPRHDDDAETNASVKMTEPAPTRPAFSSTVKPSQPASAYPRPGSTTSKPNPASPHGTRPATLYYSTSPRKDKEEPSPTMKSTPTASPTSSTTAPSTAATRPAAATTASSVRPASVVDYRTNVERQSREQKSVGGILSILVYSLIGFFVLGAALAGYGAYVVSAQLHQQSVTVSQLDDKYAAADKDLNTKLASTLDTLTQAQAQIERQQDLITQQQATISKLLASAQDTAAAIKAEKAARASETASIRSRLKDLEYQAPTTRKY